MDPINYGALQTQLNLTPLLQGLQVRSQNQAYADQRADRDADNKRQDATLQLARDKFTVDQQNDADYVKAVQAYQANPTPAALRDLGVRYPEKAKALMEAGNSYTTAQKQDLVGAGFSALGALSANNPQLAITTLQQRVDALKNSGIDTSHTQAAIDMIKSGDVKGATAYLSYAMGGLVGTDHAAGVLETLGVGKKAENEDRRLDLADRREAETERHNSSTEAISARAADRADRKAAGGSRKAPKLPGGFILD